MQNQEGISPNTKEHDFFSVYLVNIFSILCTLFAVIMFYITGHFVFVAAFLTAAITYGAFNFAIKFMHYKQTIMLPDSEPFKRISKWLELVFIHLCFASYLAKIFIVMLAPYASAWIVLLAVSGTFAGSLVLTKSLTSIINKLQKPRTRSYFNRKSLYDICIDIMLILSASLVSISYFYSLPVILHASFLLYSAIATVVFALQILLKFDDVAKLGFDYFRPYISCVVDHKEVYKPRKDKIFAAVAIGLNCLCSKKDVLVSFLCVYASYLLIKSVIGFFEFFAPTLVMPHFAMLLLLVIPAALLLSTFIYHAIDDSNIYFVVNKKLDADDSQSLLGKNRGSSVVAEDVALSNLQECPWKQHEQESSQYYGYYKSVSYTHLTLPTILLV